MLPHLTKEDEYLFNGSMTRKYRDDGANLRLAFAALVMAILLLVVVSGGGIWTGEGMVDLGGQVLGIMTSVK